MVDLRGEQDRVRSGNAWQVVSIPFPFISSQHALTDLAERSVCMCADNVFLSPASLSRGPVFDVQSKWLSDGTARRPVSHMSGESSKDSPVARSDDSKRELSQLLRPRLVQRS